MCLVFLCLSCEYDGIAAAVVVDGNFDSKSRSHVQN